MRSRLPVHQSLTKTTARHLPLLEAKLNQSLAATAAAKALRDAAGRPVQSPPAPQLLAVAVVGRVLTAEQVAAGRYIPAEDVAAAQQLLLPASMTGGGVQQEEILATAEELPEGEEGYASAARGVLEGLIGEIWADADVAAAFEAGSGRLGTAVDQLPSIGELRAGLLAKGGAGSSSTGAAGVGACGDVDGAGGSKRVRAAAVEAACERQLLSSGAFQAAAQVALEQVAAGLVQEQLEGM